MGWVLVRDFEGDALSSQPLNGSTSMAPDRFFLFYYYRQLPIEHECAVVTLASEIVVKHITLAHDASSEPA